MAIVVIFHSETGHTEGIARYIAKETGGNLIRVNDLAQYNFITKYLIGGRRATRGERDEIEPSEIDVGEYDLMVIGSPVWSGHPTPAINAAIGALRHCEGKEAVSFTTCGGMPGDSLLFMKRALERRGVSVKGGISFTRKELTDQKKLNILLDLVKSASIA